MDAVYSGRGIPYAAADGLYGAYAARLERPRTFVDTMSRA
jgi:hypothetical protein